MDPGGGVGGCERDLASGSDSDAAQARRKLGQGRRTKRPDHCRGPDDLEFGPSCWNRIKPAALQSPASPSEYSRCLGPRPMSRAGCTISAHVAASGMVAELAMGSKFIVLSQVKTCCRLRQTLLSVDKLCSQSVSC